MQNKVKLVAPAPGQVYWNGRLGRMAVVYAVNDTGIKAIGISMNSGKVSNRVKRYTWSNGVPSTWTLYLDSL